MKEIISMRVKTKSLPRDITGWSILKFCDINLSHISFVNRSGSAGDSVKAPFKITAKY